MLWMTDEELNREIAKLSPEDIERFVERIRSHRLSKMAAESQSQFSATASNYPYRSTAKFSLRLFLAGF